MWNLWENDGEIRSARVFRVGQDPSSPPVGPFRVCWDPTGAWVATVTGGDATIWSMIPAQRWMEANGPDAISPFVGDDETPQVKASVTRYMKLHVDVHTLPVQSGKTIVDMSFSKMDPPMIALGYSDGTIQILIKRETFVQVRTLAPVPALPTGIDRLLFCTATDTMKTEGRQVLVSMDSSSTRIIVWDVDSWVQTQTIRFDRPDEAGALLLSVDPSSNFVFLTERERGAVYALRLERSGSGEAVCPRFTGLTAFPLAAPVLSMVTTDAQFRLSSSEASDGALDGERDLNMVDFTFESYCISARKVEKLTVGFSSGATDWAAIAAAAPGPAVGAATAASVDAAVAAPAAPAVAPPPAAAPPAADQQEALLAMLKQASQASQASQESVAPAPAPVDDDSSPEPPSGESLLAMLNQPAALAAEAPAEASPSPPGAELLSMLTQAMPACVPEPVPEPAAPPKVDGQLQAQLNKKDQHISSLLAKLANAEREKREVQAKAQAPLGSKQGVGSVGDMDAIFSFMQQQSKAIEMLSESVQKQREQMTALRTDFSRSEAKLLAEIQAAKQSSAGGGGAQEAEKTKRLLAAISTTFHQSLSSAISEAVGNAAEDTGEAMVPAINKAVESALGDSLIHKLSGALAQGFNAVNVAAKAAVPKLVTAPEVTAKLAEALTQPVASAMVTTFEATLIPAIQASCREMFGQTNAAISRGVQQHITAIGPEFQNAFRTQQQVVTSMVEQQRALGEDMKRRQTEQVQVLSAIVRKELSQFQPAAAASPAPPPAAVALPDDPPSIQQLLAKVKQGRYQEAFSLALAANDLSLVLQLCKALEPSYIFNLQPLPLEQAVILSLVQQLTQRLEEETDVKMGYLQEAVMAINARDPATKEYIPMVVSMLDQKLQLLTAAPETTPASRNSMRMLSRLMSSSR